MTKLNDDEFEELGFMEFIAKDVPMEYWPRWLSSILENVSRAKVYPMVLKENEKFYFLYTFYGIYFQSR